MHLPMYKDINKICLVILLSGVLACVDTYEPDISKYEDVIVVDGELSNLSGPYEVRLSTGFTFDEDSGATISGAQVKIIESTGLEILLEEIRDGVYQTVDSAFRGVPGNSYKLHIEYNNEVYESEMETLEPPVPIDRIYWEYEERENLGTDGIQLYLDTHDSLNSEYFYAWDYEETWKFTVPYMIPDKPEWNVCYRYSKSNDFIIGTSIRNTNNRIKRYPLLFIDNNTNRLFLHYSILVKQYALSEQAYQFFKDLITLNDNQGTLFDPIPYAIVGNLKNLSNRDKPVLGYFLVAGVSEKRIFIDNDDLPFEYIPVSGFESCYLALLDVPLGTDLQNDPAIIEMGNQGLFMFDLDTIRGEFLLLSFTNSAGCYNCTVNGDNHVPDFWDE